MNNDFDRTAGQCPHEHTYRVEHLTGRDQQSGEAIFEYIGTQCSTCRAWTDKQE